MSTPLVSVIVANFNGGAFVEAALRSALTQSLSDLEVIFVDDRSSDDSLMIARRLAQDDPRLRVFANTGAKGPGGARNFGLKQARGAWCAVFDSDDLMGFRRLERLVAAATEDGADIVADDLLVFHQDGSPPTSVGWVRRARWIDAREFAARNHLFAPRPNLGFAKPLFRRVLLEASPYTEDMRIAEDYDFLMRLLLRGAKFRLYPQATYLYRKHAASTSHRLTAGHVDEMLAADEAVAGQPNLTPSVRRALRRRRASLARAGAYVRLLDALKARRWGEAAGLLVRSPGVLPMLYMPIAARWRRLTTKAPAPAKSDGARRCCFISRQRLVGATNGSSAYLLALARAARRAGLEPHLLQPSPLVTGRWPILRLHPEMAVFASCRYRGAVKVGRLIFSLRPSVYWAAFLTGLERLCAKAGLKGLLSVPRAPYSIAAPWLDADLLCVAKYAPALSDVVVLDYAFQNEAIAYCLRPDAQTLVVMHDLFSARADHFRDKGATDSVTALSAIEEFALLDLAGAVVAIQNTEAQAVRAALLGKSVVLAPMPADLASAPQPGPNDDLLFVASNSAPNVIGLQWFFDLVWPKVRAARPAARLIVAGNVNRAFTAAPEGVKFIGMAPDLDALYARAGVVICPLTAGSGLKIKLVEALAKGKAIVATRVALQGVESLESAVLCADDPAAFATALTDLLGDANQRQALGVRSLAAALSFAPDVSLAEFERALGQVQPAAAAVRRARKVSARM